MCLCLYCLQMTDADQGSVNNNVQVVERPAIKSNKKRNIILVLVVLVLVAFLGVGTWYILDEPQPQGGVAVIEESAQPSPTPEPTLPPEPVERSEIKIQVLNGTGVPGEAGLFKDELEGLDYEDIDTANADNTDYTSAVVTFSQDLSPTVVSEITELLEKFYSNLTTSTDELDEYDVVIITGEREGMARATATPTPVETADDSSEEDDQE